MRDFSVYIKSYANLFNIGIIAKVDLPRLAVINYPYAKELLSVTLLIKLKSFFKSFNYI